MSVTQADRLTKLTSQLIGDIGRLPGVVLDSAGEAQLVQLLTDAFEEVGMVALENHSPAAACVISDCEGVAHSPLCPAHP